MKVALLNDQLNAGGAEKVLVNIANMMHSRGVQVIVVLFMSTASLDKQLHPQIPVHYLHRKGRFDRAAMGKLKLLLQPCDIVHIHSRYNLRYFMVAKYVQSISHPKVVFHEHVPGYTKLDFFTRMLFKGLNAYIAVLQSICDWANSQHLVQPSKVFYLPNIVAQPANPIVFIQNKHHRIVMVGNFRRVKNHLFAIQLAEQLNNGTTLDLYGMIEDQGYYDELVRYINNHNLGEKVNIIRGVNNLYDVIGRYDIALHTATHETGPLVLLEYMQAGLPFLTYKTGDVAHNISSSLPQLVMQTFNQGDWLASVNTLLTNESLRQTIKLNMKQVVQENYTEEKYWQQLSNVYKQVLQ